jgi:hypothetical protein
MDHPLTSPPSAADGHDLLQGLRGIGAAGHVEAVKMHLEPPGLGDFHLSATENEDSTHKNDGK